MTFRLHFFLPLLLVACSSGGGSGQTPDDSGSDDAPADASLGDTPAEDATTDDGASDDADAATSDDAFDDVATTDSASEASSTDASTDGSVIDSAKDAPSSDAVGDTGTCTAPTRGDAATGCNDLTIAGTPVNPVQVASKFTGSWTGGTIAAGTYFMTKLTIYTGPGGASGTLNTGARQVVRVACNHVDEISEDKTGVPVQIDDDATFAGAKMTLHTICPSDATTTLDYSATSTGFTDGFTDPLGNYRVTEYAKQ